MTKPNPAPDPIADALDEAGRLYILLAGKVQPGHSAGDDGRVAARSRPPLVIDPVSLMAELEQYLGWWLAQARWFLNPTRRIDITKRTGAVCPWCMGGLVAWLRTPPDDPNDTRPVQVDEVVCETPTQHEPDQPYRWAGEAEWRRLGVLAGVYSDARYGPQFPAVAET